MTRCSCSSQSQQILDLYEGKMHFILIVTGNIFCFASRLGFFIFIFLITNEAPSALHVSAGSLQA